MKWIKQKNGQITITALTGIIGLIGMIGVPFVYISNIKAETIKADSEIRERIVKLETTIVNTDKNVAEIKEDLKDLKVYFKIK